MAISLIPWPSHDVGRTVRMNCMQGQEVMHCAAMLFLGMVDDATPFAETRGDGGSGAKSGWGRDKDDDDRAWARRSASGSHRQSAHVPPTRECGYMTVRMPVRNITRFMPTFCGICSAESTDVSELLKRGIPAAASQTTHRSRRTGIHGWSCTFRPINKCWERHTMVIINGERVRL